MKRAHPRVSSDITVSVKVKGGGPVTAGQIRNISLGGLFIEMEPLKFGVELDLTFRVPGGKSNMRCTGYIVWNTDTNPDRARMTGVGVRLTDITVADMRALSDFVATQLENG